jgi:Spy/CpxP family protein refolding chaperone
MVPSTLAVVFFSLGTIYRGARAMKQFFAALMLLTVFSIVPGPATAAPLQGPSQNPSQEPAQEPAPAPQAEHKLTPEKVVSMLDSKLALSDDQKNKITPIIADRQEKMRALRSDTSLRPMQRRRKAKEIMSDSDQKIKAVLTPDQQQKYAEMEQQMRDEAKERRQEQKANPN